MTIQQRVLGKTGLKISAIGFGAAETGYAGVPPRTVSKILDAARDAGVNLIDTAACYGDGEDQIGAALAGRRDNFVLLTKCGHAAGLPGRDWEPKMLAASIDRSLKRLKTDRVDVMQFHSPDAATLRDDRVVEVLTRARDAGKTCFIGCSADGVDALAAVELGIFDTLQISVSIADQEAIDLVLPKAQAQRLGIIAKRPIANAAWRSDSRDAYSAPYRERLHKLAFDFARHRDAAATALRFTLSVKEVDCAIVGTARAQRFAENAAALALGPLPDDQFDSIRRRWHAVATRNWVGQR